MNKDPYRRPGSGLPLILAGAAFVMTAWLLYERMRPSSLFSEVEPRAITPRGELADFEKASMEIFSQNAPSVVHITSPEVRRRTGYYVTTIPEGTGSGFVWDAAGYVVTNYHVIQGRSRVLVRLQDHKEYEGQVVGIEQTLDIAVVKLSNHPELRPIPVGSSRELQVGQAVFAIGNPFGLDHSLSTGVISALERVIESVAGTPIRGVIQTDAAINPGNSGGPLLDSAGRLIGMNTAIKSTTRSSAGIGFAVPVDTINRVVSRLISGDPGEQPALGVELQTMNFQDRSRNPRRLIPYPVVMNVLPDTGAAEAGLIGQSESSEGDLITGIRGKGMAEPIPVARDEDLRTILDQHEIGDTVYLNIVRRPRTGDWVNMVVPVTLKTSIQRQR